MSEDAIRRILREELRAHDEAKRSSSKSNYLAFKQHVVGPLLAWVDRIFGVEKDVKR